MQIVLPTLAAVSSLTLAAAALVGRPRLRVQWLFALGMLGLAAESVCAIRLLTTADADSVARAWLTAAQVVALALLVPWAFFLAVVADLQMPSVPRVWRVALGVGVVATAASAVAVTLSPAFVISPVGWDLGGAFVARPGHIAAIVQLLVTVGILAGLETCLRTARGSNRGRVKYLVLGLGAIFLSRFYVLSQILLFHAVTPTYVKTTCAALFVSNLLLAVPIARDQLRGAQITVSRQMLYRSAIIGVLGLYLFVVAALGSLLTYLAIPEETFWASVVVFASALGLSALLLSDGLRWRVKRFIAVNFYRSKYDYRQQWIAFTGRLSTLLTTDEIGRELIEGVTEATGATSGAIYLAESPGAPYRLRGHVGRAGLPTVIEPTSPVFASLRARDGAVALPAELARLVSPDASAVVAPLRWRASTIGLMVLGPERTGADYTIEDFEFLSTVAAQAAATIVTARLSESMAQAREIETFDRVTAAVIHDIKNSVSALSMLSRNAQRNFDDPEFQRDTITTLARTVERMRRLLTRLSSPMSDPRPLQAEPVDLAALVLEATTPLAGDARLRLVRDIRGVREVAGDRDALLRVLENLITNAAEAIEGNGTITVTLAEENGRALITVSDTGCGISEEFLQRHLFLPFRSTKKGGWGIGLYHTKQIIEHHDGTIRVDSVEGKGTTFAVTLPLWEASR